MIGQRNLQSRIKKLIDEGTFPRFSILVGLKGSGKKTLANWIRRCMGQNELTISYEATDVKIDTIRDIIEGAYRTAVTNIYIIPDADKMSNAAKNALLKVTEEPPNNAYFIMTLEDENNTLETIRSRGTVFYMDIYTPDEINECAEKVLGSKPGKIWTDLCETPGDVEILKKSNPIEFYDYVELVVDNIAEVSVANVFKIPGKISLKDDMEGYDLRLFFKAFMNICWERSYDRDTKAYCDAIAITSKYLQQLRIKGVNKQQLIDNWILDVREVLPWQ